MTHILAENRPFEVSFLFSFFYELSRYLILQKQDQVFVYSFSYTTSAFPSCEAVTMKKSHSTPILTRPLSGFHNRVVERTRPSVDLESR